jgi:hypothetical protein
MHDQFLRLLKFVDSRQRRSARALRSVDYPVNHFPVHMMADNEEP